MKLIQRVYIARHDTFCSELGVHPIKECKEHYLASRAAPF